MKDKNNNKKIKSGLKILSVSLLSFAVLLAVSSVGGTVSYFRDNEDSLDNYFRADPISFKVETILTQIDLTSEKKVEIVMTPDETSEPIQYFVTSKVVSGSEEFCQAINVFGTWPFPINGRIDSIVTETSTSTGSWTLNVSAPEDQMVANKSCVVELSYFGWNAGAELGHAFTDTRKLTFEFYIPTGYSSSKSVVVPEPAPPVLQVETFSAGGESTPTEENVLPKDTPLDNSTTTTAIEVPPPDKIEVPPDTQVETLPVVIQEQQAQTNSSLDQTII